MEIRPDDKNRLTLPEESRFSDIYAWLSLNGKRVSKSKILDFNFKRYSNALPVLVSQNEAPFVCNSVREISEQMARLKFDNKDYYICDKNDLKWVTGCE